MERSRRPFLEFASLLWFAIVMLLYTQFLFENVSLFLRTAPGVRQARSLVRDVLRESSEPAPPVSSSTPGGLR